MARPAFLILCVFVAACDSFTDPSARRLTGEVAAIPFRLNFQPRECDCVVLQDLSGVNKRRFAMGFSTRDSLIPNGYGSIKFSNDGSGILAVYGTTEKTALVMMRPFGATPVIISAPDERAQMGDWIPGDSLIVYAASKNNGQTFVYRIYDVRTGTRRTVLEKTAVTGGTGFYDAVRFSADGKKIFGAQNVTQSPSLITLHEVDVETGALREMGDVPHGTILHIDRTGDRVWLRKYTPSRAPNSLAHPLIRYDLDAGTMLNLGLPYSVAISNDDQYLATSPHPTNDNNTWVSILTNNGVFLGYAPGAYIYFAINITSAR